MTILVFSEEVLNKSLVESLLTRYRPKILARINREDIKRLGLEEDVLQEVNIKIQAYIENGQDIYEIPSKLNLWILSAINKVIKHQKKPFIVIQEKNIKQYYEKVQHIVNKGYHEDEAKILVKVEESLLRGRVIYNIDYDGLSPQQKDELFYNNTVYNAVCGVIEILYSQGFNYSECIIFAHDFAKAQALCLDRLRSLKGGKAERDYHILIDAFYKRIPQNKVAKKNGLSDGRISQIVDRAADFIAECIKEKVGV